MRKIILHLVITIFSLGFLIVFAGNIDASNNLFTVSPTINNITIDPGETLQKQLLVKNGGSQDINVTATVQKFSPTGSAGKINFSDSEGNSLISLSNNSSVIVTSISQTISSLATLQIPVSISAPKNVSPGGYYYSIIVKEVNKGSDVSVTPNIAALYFITVSGELKKSASIESFDIPHINLHDLSIIAGDKVTFTTVVKNNGNIHIQPQVIVKVTNTFGNDQTFKYPSHTIIPGESLKLSTNAKLLLPKFFDRDIFTERIINEGKTLDTKQYSLYIFNIQNILRAIGGIYFSIAILVLIIWVISKRHK